jgi:hypothetical protein
MEFKTIDWVKDAIQDHSRELSASSARFIRIGCEGGLLPFEIPQDWIGPDMYADPK